MAKSIPIVNTSTDTFSVWVDRTNDIIDVVNTVVITANSTFGKTTGNSYLSGIFSANSVAVYETLRGGNVTTTNVLTISSNVNISADKLTIGVNTINSTSFSVSSISLLPVMMKVSANTIGLTSQLVDQFPLNSYSGCDYSLVIKDTTVSSNAYQISRLALVHNSLSVYSTEYGVMYSNSIIGTFSTSISGANATLNFTPLVGCTSIIGIRTVIDKI